MTLSKTAYQHVHGLIADGSFAPGDVISESAIAKELGFSRTPIGEALRRLADDGLVKQVPRFGTIVREIPLKELIEHFEVREALESYAAGKAAERISEDALQDLKKICKRIDQEIIQAASEGKSCIEGEALRRFLSADMAFHLLIISAARNKQLLKFARRTGSIAEVFHARRGSHTLQRVKDANTMHEKIVDALIKRDSEAASKLAAEHVRFSAAISSAAEETGRMSNELASLSGLDLKKLFQEEEGE